MKNFPWTRSEYRSEFDGDALKGYVSMEGAQWYWGARRANDPRYPHSGKSTSRAKAEQRCEAALRQLWEELEETKLFLTRTRKG